MGYEWRKAWVFLVAALLSGCGSVHGLRFDPDRGPIESQLLAEIALERGEYAEAVNQYLNVARQSNDPEFARRATELGYEYGFDAHALAAAERWVVLEPDNRAAHTLLGILQVRFGRLDAAWDSLAFGLGPPELRTDQVYAGLAGDLSPAARQGLQLFERFNTVFPDTPGITRSLAELAVQAGDLGRGIAAARQTISLRPEWLATRVWLARLLLLDGQRSSAFEQMAFALETNPGPAMELEFVQLLAAAGELEEAAARLERISERFPDGDAIPLAGAELLMQAGQFDSAEDIYVQMLSANRCRYDCYWNLGRIAFAREDYRGAIVLFRRVGPGEWLQPASRAIARSFQAMGDAQAALEELEQFAADYPKWAFDTLQPRATLLLEQQRFDEAEKLMAEALEYRPWSEELWLALGGVLEQSGKRPQALDAFRTAWELAPESAAAQNAYGYTLTLLTRRYAEAQKLIARALEQQPQNPAFMDSMGWVLFRQGDTAAARVWLERAFASLEDPEIAAHLGELLWVSGERQAAKEFLADAVESFPDNQSLRDTIERLLN